MAKDTNLVQTVPFTFDEIYQGIAQKFAEKGYDSPYDGSNLAQLITSMAYTTSMLNANTAININETILPLAQKRPNVVQDARLLGYEAAQKVSFIYEIQIKFLNTQFYTIEKHSAFTQGQKTYYYMGEDIDINATAGDTINIRVKEGILKTYINEPTTLSQVIANKQYLDIPYTDVEQNGIEVYVTNYTIDGILTSRIKYTQAETLLIDFDDSLGKKFIRIEDADMNTPRIYFVLSGVGNPIPVGAMVDMNVLISSADKGEMIDIPKTTIPDIEILNYTLDVKGTIVESIESIKENAPVLHNTANRVVTANDYRVVSQKHSACLQAFIFGGEDEHPVKLGNIFLSFTPEKRTRTFTVDTENTSWTLDDKEDITNNYLLDSEIVSPDIIVDGPGVLDTIRALNLPALKYNIRNPMYTFMDIQVKIAKYSLSSKHKDVREQVFNIIDDYVKKLEIFEVEFFKSNLVKRIDEYLTDITGLDMDVQFNVMVDSKSIVQENEDFNEFNVFLYLDTSYEGTYDTNGYLLNTAGVFYTLPQIDTLDFLPGEDLTVDFTYTPLPGVKDSSRPSIEFPVMLNGNQIGTYTIFNDRTIYIRVKLFLTDGVNFPVYPGILPMNIADFNTPRYIHLEYPSKNLETLRNTIFKLNTVEIH